MKKTFIVIAREYLRMVRRRSFVGALLLPIFLFALIGIVTLLSLSSFEAQERGAIGYVDPSNALARARAAPDERNSFVRFDTEASARAALEGDAIIAYYALAPDFAQSSQAELFYWKNEPSRDARRAFERFARSALVAEFAPQVASRLVAGAGVSFETSDGSRRLDAENPIGYFVPMIFGIVFVVSVFSGAQYLLQAVVEEKQNRTMEILVTSVSPLQLMSGKIVGLALVGLTQIFVWIAAAAVALQLAQARVPFLDSITLDPQLIVVATILFTLDYLLLGSMMAAVGATVVDQKDGQSVSGPFSLIAMMPFFFIAAIFIDPNGTVSTLLSLFPITAPLAMTLRVGMATVPLWQITLSVFLMGLTTALAFWLAARIFRAGMLEYGKSIPFMDVVRNLRV